MYVAALELVDYRSYRQVDVALPPGVTVFVGPNGQGKTNLVEAIGYLATLASHRVASDAPLVRRGAERAVIRAQVVRDARHLMLELEITPGKTNRARLGRAPVARPRELVGVLRTVLFAPEDLALVRGEPEGRRRFLDELATQLTPRLAGVRADYDRVLRQRNALLKSAAAARKGGDLSTLEVWDSHLATTGAELLAARLDLVDRLRPHLVAGYQAIAPAGGGPEITYRSSLPPDLVPDESSDREGLTKALAAAIEARRSDELDRGISLVGPHRDDLMLALGELPAKGHASHGESWSFALGLRLAAFALLRADGDDPVLILDDVFAELDVGRRERLAGYVAGAEQVLVTAAVPEDVPAVLAGTRFVVGDGEVHRV